MMLIIKVLTAIMIALLPGGIILASITLLVVRRKRKG